MENSTRIVDALPVSDRETVYRDRKLPRFGVRVHPSGSKVYMVGQRQLDFPDLERR